MFYCPPEISLLDTTPTMTYIGRMDNNNELISQLADSAKGGNSHPRPTTAC